MPQYFKFVNGMRNHMHKSEFHIVIKTNQNTKPVLFGYEWMVVWKRTISTFMEERNEREIKIRGKGLMI